MDRTMKFNEQDDDSMNFDDNYNEEQFLKQQNTNQKIQKLSIMNDFEQLCQKLQYTGQSNQKREQQAESDNPLTQYYAKCKQKNTDLAGIGDQPKYKTSEDLMQSNNKPSPAQNKQIRSVSDTDFANQQNLRMPLSKTHERNPSCEQNLKKVQQIEHNQNKRNYSSVQEKKKILQPSKNMSNNQNNVIMKDYFGQQNSYVNRKIHGRNFINNQPRNTKIQAKHDAKASDKQAINTQTNKFKNENSIKQSNLMKRSSVNQKDKYQKATDKIEKPRIILYKKIIDLTQSTEAIIQAFKNEQMKSDYEIFSESQSTIEQGLFAKAIVHQRAAKTVQNVHSPQYNHVQPFYKQQNINHNKYISSPININYSPNPTNAYNSIFQKRQNYLR